MGLFSGSGSSCGPSRKLTDKEKESYLRVTTAAAVMGATIKGKAINKPVKKYACHRCAVAMVYLKAGLILVKRFICGEWNK